jgi:predicted aspartyl protease
MRRIPFCAFLISVGYFSFVPLIGAQTTAARVPMRLTGGLEIVQVLVNGTGPYDFILDTGSNITLIKRQLLRKLNIPNDGSVTIVTASGETHNQRATVNSIAIAGLTVEHLEVNEFDGTPAGLPAGRVQGILGENFLGYFDILIDNEQQTLILDRTSSLAHTLAGEHLQLSRFGRFNLEPTSNRIVVKLKVRSFLQKPLLFLVDSGANTAMLYPERGLALRAMQNSQPDALMTLGETHDCRVQMATLEIGSGSIRNVRLVACESMTRDKIDTDGLLPTDVFHQLFISHRGAYLIANPRPAKHADELLVK